MQRCGHGGKSNSLLPLFNQCKLPGRRDFENFKPSVKLRDEHNEPLCMHSTSVYQFLTFLSLCLISLPACKYVFVQVHITVVFADSFESQLQVRFYP